MGGPVTWFEINTGDAKAIREFYADLFGWNMQVLEEANYTLVDTGAEGASAAESARRRGPTRSCSTSRSTTRRPTSTGSRMPAAQPWYR